MRWCSHDVNMQNDITKERIKRNSGTFVEIEEIATGKLFYGYEDVANNFNVCKETVRKHVQNIVLKPRWRLTGKRTKENLNLLLDKKDSV